MTSIPGHVRKLWNGHQITAAAITLTGLSVPAVNWIMIRQWPWAGFSREGVGLLAVLAFISAAGWLWLTVGNEQEFAKKRGQEQHNRRFHQRGAGWWMAGVALGLALLSSSLTQIGKGQQQIQQQGLDTLDVLPPLAATVITAGGQRLTGQWSPLTASCVQLGKQLAPVLEPINGSFQTPDARTIVRVDLQNDNQNQVQSATTLLRGLGWQAQMRACTGVKGPQATP